MPKEYKKINLQPGQIKDIQKKYPFATAENSEITSEGGRDTGETFVGNFIVKIIKSPRKHIKAIFRDGAFYKQT